MNFTSLDFKLNHYRKILPLKPGSARNSFCHFGNNARVVFPMIEWISEEVILKIEREMNSDGFITAR
jgi:hypothetical protein